MSRPQMMQLEIRNQTASRMPTSSTAKRRCNQADSRESRTRENKQVDPERACRVPPTPEARPRHPTSEQTLSGSRRKESKQGHEVRSARAAMKQLEDAQCRLTVELSGARADVWAWHFIPHAPAPAIC